MADIRDCDKCGAHIEIEGKNVKIEVRKRRAPIFSATCSECKEWIRSKVG